MKSTTAQVSSSNTTDPPATWWGQQLASALQNHWPEYLMEGIELGLFMISACLFVVLLEYPASPVYQALPDPTLRRVLIGIAMGITAISIIYSPFGQRSGAHFNPAVTLTFLRLGKVTRWDAFFYAFAQFIGGTLGVFIAAAFLGMLIADPTVNYAATMPGSGGPWVAFGAEVLIAFLQMSIVLRVSNTKHVARYTGIFAGIMVAIYISIEAPYSGMSMNPARTFASAFPSHIWNAWWVYYTAPLVGMLSAAELYRHQHGLHQVFCAKLHHYNDERCIFRCRFDQLVNRSQ
ncbi:MAG: MIP/aquaporin family protein [Candidatus Binatia bacterium]